MKVGQMASYVDDGLPEPVRQALATLQAGAPPMSAELAAEVVERELGRPPDEAFLEWDPEPIAAASIGQVHRAVALDAATGRERAVAVKVQYPGVADAIEADLANTELLGSLLRQGFAGLDPSDMVAEIKERITEELDYRREAANQTHFATFYRGHPFFSVPAVLPALSTGRVLTSELVVGAPWRELLTWDQHQRDVAGEGLFRFVFRSLYRMRAFNGDPHPGNYVFHGDGRITFLDFGLVRYFSEAEIATCSRRWSRRRRSTTMPTGSALVERQGCSAPEPRWRPTRPARTSPSSTSRWPRIVRCTGRKDTPAPSCATRSIARARSPSTPPCHDRSCSSSASTWGSTPCWVTSGRRATTGGWPRSCGRSSTALHRRRWVQRKQSGCEPHVGRATRSLRST